MKKELIVNKDDVQLLSFEEVLNKYMAHILYLSKPYMKYYEYEDLIQIGSMALWEAYEKYDISREIGFGYYAKIFIRNELSHFIRDQYKHKIKWESYNKTFNLGGKDIEISETLESEYNGIQEIESEIYVEYLLDNLDEEQRKVVELKTKGYTQKDIAKVFNSNQVWVSRRIATSRKKLLEVVC